MIKITIYGKQQSGKSTFEAIAKENFPDSKLEFLTPPTNIGVKIKVCRQYELRANNLSDMDDSDNWMDRIPNSEFDYIVNNNGDLGLLEGAVLAIINDVLRRQK